MSTNQGGAREGAGRKPVAPITVMKSILLTPEQWDKAKRIGRGVAAKGIRKAIDSFKI